MVENELHDRPLCRRQLRQRRHDAFLLPGSGGQLGYRRRAVRQALFLIQQIQVPPAQIAHSLVVGDPEQPRAHRRPAPKGRSTAPGSHEGILQQVFSGGCVAGETAEEGEDAAGVTFVQLRQRLGVAGHQAVQQRLVCLGETGHQVSSSGRLCCARTPRLLVPHGGPAVQSRGKGLARGHGLKRPGRGLGPGRHPVDPD